MNNFREKIKVSALVSTYNSDKYFEGCINDLLEQTLYQQGLLEIIVIDCASPGNEIAIGRAYQDKFKNITYLRLSERETLYGAWNVGIQASNGIYLTNANTDDRHHFQCLEKKYLELERNPAIDLVYADVYSSKIDNEIFPQNDKSSHYHYKEYFAPDVVLAYQFGCQPMWRKSVHEKIGVFNSTLKAAGDYEFNFRFNLAGLKAVHIPEVLGLFLEREQSISKADSTSTDEQLALRNKYINAQNILTLYNLAGYPVNTLAEQISVFEDLLKRASNIKLPWHPNDLFQDAGVIALCQQALAILQTNQVASRYT